MNRSKTLPSMGLMLAAFALLVMGALFAATASALTVNVVDGDGNPVSGFRWMLEEDNSFHVTPGVHTLDALALNFHRSYAPVVLDGSSDTSSATLTPPAGAPADTHYLLSVRPYAGFAMSGASVAPGQDTVTVTVQAMPLPTAQISVLVFDDSRRINGAPDLPEEQGLAGFTVRLIDAGGRYGISGGPMIQDAFGNPLGTTYNADGSVATMGDGVLKSGPDGTLLIKNLVPAKYTIEVIPPAGQDWHQTSTIEGTPGIDAWVKSNEPAFFQEFGPPGHHVFIGFVHTINDTTVLTGGSTITGRVVNNHMSRPPDYTFYNGQAIGSCWIGLNAAAGAGPGVYANACNSDGTFSIPNVPPGSYELVVWDKPLDNIIAFHNVTVPPGGGEVALLDVPVFSWFSKLTNQVFFDTNGNGYRDAGEPGMPEQNINIRFRDGSIYQAMPTDVNGESPFEQVFPFFNWLVAEVDYARFKPTGVTVTVDNGGPIDPNDPLSFEGVLNPQPQCTSGAVSTGDCVPAINPVTGNNLQRTETGPVLLEAFQSFLGQTQVLQWGKQSYAPGENGGISGVVYYASTRAENDPRYAAPDPWEPGIARVQVSLYQDSDRNGVIDDLDGSGDITLADVDNAPFGWRTGGAMGAEDVDHNGNGSFDAGDAIQIVTTDSWDDSRPSGCQGEKFTVDGVPLDCYDGLRNFNQVRPGVFDGGYWFNSYVPGGIVSGAAEVTGLPAGSYIVAAATPPGYKTVAEESKNVELGEVFKPAPQLLPPICVGETHLVPAYVSGQTDASGTPLPGIATADLIAAPFAGDSRPLCDRKLVALNDAQNAAADFFMFTEVPKAARVTGFILDDLSNEFDPNSPQFGEKYAPPWLPISIRDWTGKEIQRFYSDEWGTYNTMLPSTFTANVPSPSGYGPNMLTACMNSPGPIQNPAYNPADPNSPQYIIDPHFDRKYSQFCYVFDYMPGTTTYLDTPVVPVAAFAGASQFPVDCEQPNATPMIYSVSGPNGGPYVEPGQSLTITALGPVDVPNPAYDGTNAKTISRTYSFGTSPGSVTVDGQPLSVQSWSDGAVTVQVPAGTDSGELIVTDAGGNSTPFGVHLTVGPISGAIHYVQPSTAPGAHPIQDAIDVASSGDLILIAPGIYEEMVVMWKPVQLQGWGAPSVSLNAVKTPAEKLSAWRNKINSLYLAGQFDLVPGQAAPGFDPVNNEPLWFQTEEGPGIIVLARRNGPNRFAPRHAPRINGLTITGADYGGGIYLNGYANNLEISGNRLVSNMGTYGGGIRVGSPNLIADTPQGLVYADSENRNLNIHHNAVIQNGSIAETSGAGGGIALYTGSRNYRVAENFVCGNFSQGHGGGIGHVGLSDGGRIEHNSIVFNQSFFQGQTVNGGGLYIAGAPAAGAAGGLTDGTGSVTVDGNLIQGNQAGAGDGGGISAAFINGADVAGQRNNPNRWYRLDLFNNFIVNNVAGLAGGGISLQDATRVRIFNNTVVHNDSTGTAGAAFAAGSPNQSTAQPAGIVARAHSPLLAATIGNAARVQSVKEFSNPEMVNDIVWQNRSFYWRIDTTADPETFGLVPDVGAGQAAVFDDLGVLGVVGRMNPTFSILTDATGYDTSNLSVDPLVVDAYFNGDRGQTIQMPELTTSIATAPALDEGGNFIDVRFGPLSLTGNYHLQSGSPAVNSADTAAIGGITELAADIDGELRPAMGDADIGADEVQP